MELINVGAGANDGTGDPLRTAFQKVNANTTELGVSINTSSDSTFNEVRLGRGNGNISTNTAIGVSALLSNTSGNQNIAAGLDSMRLNNTGVGNSAFGKDSLRNSNGNGNTAIGLVALYSHLIGDGNTAIGASALYNNNTSGNTAIGNAAGSNNAIFSNTTCLGFQSQITGSNQVQLGDSATTTYVYGTVQNRSDLRDKADVQDTILGLDFISKLRPVDYKWDMRESYKSELPIQGELSDEDFKVVMDAWLIDNKLSNLEHNGTKKRNRFHHGFIAQEVRDLGFGGFQDHSVNGGEDVLSIGYDEFIAPMVKAIQELKAEIELLKKK